MVLGFGADCNVDDAAGSRAEVWWPSASKLGASATLNVREKVLARKVDFLFTSFESRNRNF